MKYILLNSGNVLRYRERALTPLSTIGADAKYILKNVIVFDHFAHYKVFKNCTNLVLTESSIEQMQIPIHAISGEWETKD